MPTIYPLQDMKTAHRIGQFLVGPNVFDQTWAPEEKEIVTNAPIQSLGNIHHQFWYAEEHGEIIAAMGIRENKYGSGGYEMDEDYMAVHIQHRRKKIASKLLEIAEEFVKNHKGRYIHVLSCDIDSYKAARSFYTSHGYREVAKIPDYYVSGEGRVDYIKYLK